LGILRFKKDLTLFLECPIILDAEKGLVDYPQKAHI